MGFNGAMPPHDDPSGQLRDRLRRLWPLSGEDALREDLLDAWDRPGYHDLQHLADVLGRLAELAEAGVDYDDGTEALEREGVEKFLSLIHI